MDLYLTCSLPDMIYLVRGDLTLATALSTDRLDVVGSASARKKLSDWLNLSPLTQIKSNLPEAAAI